jgi:ubiquinone/menaquinone biosynthesis C-methylase UbiE
MATTSPLTEMTRLERWMINSPPRRWLFRLEFHAFRRLAEKRGFPVPPGARLMDVGCGRGVSGRMLLREFRPAQVVIFDSDRLQVRLAAGDLRNHRRAVALLLADAHRMPFPDASYDAVFDIATLHHITDLPDGRSGWRWVIGEVRRVLKPGGLFFFAEPSRGRLQRGIFRFTRHDPEAMFDRAEVLQALAEAGLEAIGPLGGMSLWDIAGVARRPD